MGNEVDYSKVSRCKTFISCCRYVQLFDTGSYTRCLSENLDYPHGHRPARGLIAGACFDFRAVKLLLLPCESMTVSGSVAP